MSPSATEAVVSAGAQLGSSHTAALARALLLVSDMLCFVYRWGPVLLLPLFMLMMRPPPPELPLHWKLNRSYPTSDRRSEALVSAQLVGVVNLNKASVAELERLPGVGPRLAKRIVTDRGVQPYQTTAELSRVRGIGSASVARWSKYLRVRGKTTLVRARILPEPGAFGAEAHSPPGSPTKIRP